MIKINLDMYPKDSYGKYMCPRDENGNSLEKVRLAALLGGELANGSDPVNGEKFGDWSDNLAKDNFIEVDDTDYNIIVGIINISKTFTNLLKNRLLKALRTCKEKVV